MLNKLRKLIAEWLYPIDPVYLIRKKIAPMQNYLSLDIDSLPKEEQDDLLVFAENLHKNKLFRRVIDPLVFAQLDHVAREAPTTDHGMSIWFGRGSANGIELVVEEFERLASLYSERVKRSDLFNKYDIV